MNSSTPRPQKQSNNGQHTPMVDHAIVLAEANWKVFPVFEPIGAICSCPKGAKCKDPGKHPRVTGWQTLATSNPEQIAKWWDRWPAASIGLPAGAPNRNIVVDVDPRNGGADSLAKLNKRYGKWPETLAADTGSGGLHVYFARPNVPITNGCGRLGPGIDIKSDGGFIVGPPSWHKSGRQYAWRSDASVKLAPLPPWMLELLTERRRDRDTEKQKQSLRLSVSPSLCFSDSLSLCQDIIRSHIPDREGIRNRKIFSLARALKTRHPEADPEDMRPFMLEWHKRALPFIKTTDFADSWEEFMYAWPKVKYLEGQGGLDDVLRRADASPLPACAKRYESELTQRIVKLCRELQRDAGTEPFFIACRTIARLFGFDHESAAKKMKMLREHGILQIAESHTTTRATRYLYRGGK